MDNTQFDPHGARGTLAQWTTEDGTVLQSKEALGAYVAPTSGERGYLADVYEHFGQPCVVIGWFPTDNPIATVCVRFDDGTVLYAYKTDVWFD